MGWKVVEINSKDYFQLYLNNLMVKRNFEKILININDIDTLIIHNTNARLSVKLLNALTKKNINIVIFDELHLPQSHVINFQGHHMSLKILERQIQWSPLFKSKTWQFIIKNKIGNQKALLEETGLLKNEYDFHKLIRETKPMDISNREGVAAKVYWHKLFGLNFKRDYKCQNNPFINSMLNYGYTILRSLVIRSIIKKGLDPRISIYHSHFANFFALASDIMEPFRPLVDSIAYKNKGKALFNIEIRDQLVNIINTKVIYGGKQFFLPFAINLVIDNLVRQNKWETIELWD